MDMTSNHPYMIRAIYDWLVDNSKTPYLLVDVADERVEVPLQFVEDGRIILNIGPTAVRDLELGNQFISFNARFGGKSTDILIPVSSVLSIYAVENGSGMMFPQQEDDGGEGPDDSPPPGRPALKVVK